jgi:hypothetical protein
VIEVGVDLGRKRFGGGCGYGGLGAYRYGGY